MKRFATAVVVVLLFSIPATTARAGQGDVIRRGSCSRRSDWKLKLSTQDGRIEVEFEVDQNVIGDRWRVTFRHDGDVVLKAMRTTRGASGSFEVRTVEPNHAGSDALRARARNVSTGEVCVGSASL
ncbi:MAG TPA: hypothetical protein VKC55_04935 [Actinomycetota bacterium]|nr:hypothetical protein [Actinomycetota bacterium]